MPNINVWMATRGKRLAIGLIALVLMACQSVPITGRSQLLLITEEQEIELGTEAYRETLSKSTISQDVQNIALVRRVGQRLAAVTGRHDYQWEFNLIEDSSPNAFALPGGKVAVHTGILPLTQDETGLAVVMGHEIAHALAHHGAERISTLLLTQIGVAGAAAVLGGGDPQTTKAIEEAFGIGGAIGVVLPFSRVHESEADRIGLHLMAKAGYNPREAIRFWQRMSKAGEKETLEFLSTHPSDERRIRQIESWQPEVLQDYLQSTIPR